MVAKAKRLDESRQIELAQMIEFMDDDETFLETLLDEAGIGGDGDYEKFRLSMARYWLAGSRAYLEDIVNTWLAHDNKDIYDDIPMTVVKPDDIIRVPRTTTVVDDKGMASTAEIIDPLKVKTPKSTTTYVPEKTTKPWVPSYKDEDKIIATITEILNDVPKDTKRDRPGFQGWLAGSATAALGGKTEPALMLKKVREVLESV